MNANAEVVRGFYAARNRRDWEGVEQRLSPDVIWRESGSSDYAGHHVGRATVVALLTKFVEITEGSFVLEPQELISTADHVAASVRWSASRGELAVEGNDLAVFRLADGRIAEAWFVADGFDPQALSKVFSFAAAE